MEEATTVAAKQPITEHREAYGTAKTENLRDSGLWRILLPTAVIGGCLALLATPMIFLITLLVKSLDPSNAANLEGYPLSWLWILMIVVTLIINVVIAR